ncbi:hypothetical protein BLA29_004202, partial [Euroglyphus maynei]
LWNNINDCDETYNYWEPSHFLIYGRGFQTWEYSPKYAIRSYAYLWLYMIPGRILEIFFEKIEIFYLTPFLPSSFAIYTVCLSFAFWLRANHQLFIFFFAFGSILSWPFVSAIGIPMALYLLLFRQHRKQFIITSVISAVIISVPTTLIDTYYYGRFVFASLNIILYNVFSEHGANLYGTEPFSFYIRNLFLNFNIFFLISSSSLPILMITWLVNRTKFRMKNPNWITQILINCSLHIWYLIFFCQAHKEERFMYPIYPLLCLTTSMTFTNLEMIAGCFSQRLQSFMMKLIKLSFLMFFILSIARILALYKGYYSSLNIYHKLWQPPFNDVTTTTTTRIICLGKEWHRFPGNFFIPPKYQIEFIESEFGGQLPKHFDTNVTYPTRTIPDHMNDLNQEERERYINNVQTDCDYIIDSDYPDFYGRDYPYSKHPESWTIIESLEYLDPKRSSNLLRQFYIPFIFEHKCHFISYNILA